MKYQNIRENWKYMKEYGGLRSHLKDIAHHKIGMNSLDKESRYFGFEFFWYDGPFYSIGFGFFHIYTFPDFIVAKPTPNSVHFIVGDSFSQKIKKLIKRIRRK